MGILLTQRNDYFQSVVQGKIPNESGFILSGENIDIDATKEDVRQHGTLAANYPILAAPVAMTVASSSTLDDGSPLGTGVQTVRITGINSLFALVSEDVVMNGTTAVNLVNTYYFITDICSLTVGSTGSNVGNVQVVNGANLFAYMPATENKNSSSAFFVPVGYTAFLHIFSGSFSNSNAGTRFNFNIEYKEFGANKGFLNIFKKSLTNGSSAIFERFDVPYKFNEKEIVKITGIGTAANSTAQANVFLTLVKN